MPACPKCRAVLVGESVTCPKCSEPLGASAIWFHESNPVKPFESMVPAWQWLLYAILASTCFLYSLYGLLTGEMYLPGKRGSIALHGTSAFILAAAFLCGAAHLAISLLGYPGRPGTTEFHEVFWKYTKYAAVILFFGALLTA